jgi:CRP/FNR family transcriptional regulator
MPPPAALRAIQATPYLAILGDDDRAALAVQLIVRTYGMREAILIEGSPAAGCFYLDSGKARIFRSTPEGREQTFSLVAPGDTFAEVPVLDHGPNPATVETLAPSTTVFIPSEALFAVMERRPEVAFALLRHVASRLRTFTYLVEQMGQQTVRSRLSRYLVQITRESGVPVDGGILVRRALTQEDLASLMGSVREVISRTLKVMEEDGILEVRRKEILIRDLPALEAAV